MAFAGATLDRAAHLRDDAEQLRELESSRAVLVGSAYQARSPRNPFTYQERVEAIRLALTDETGEVLGRVEDVVIAPAYGDRPPRVLGFVANVQRRRIFINANRVGSIGSTGVSLRGGTVDLRHFEARPGELFVSDLRASVAFYTETLGFRVVHADPDYVSVRNGSVVLGLGPVAKLPETGVGPGFTRQRLRADRGAGVEIVLADVSSYRSSVARFRIDTPGPPRP